MSDLFVDNIKHQSSQGSGTITIGASGETVALPEGATLSDNILFDTASKGIYLGVTSATASNLLNDYEEGTWTPTVNQGTLTSTDSTYIKVGNKVTVWTRVQSFSNTSSTAQLEITGLPFTPTEDHCSGTMFGRDIDHAYFAIISSAAGTLRFYGINSGTGYLSLKHNDLGSSSQMYLFSTYTTA